MRNKIAACIVTGMSFASLLAPVALADAAKWTCTKDGKDVKVKGASADAKKKACEGKGGTWEEAKPKADAAAPKQSSGGTGAW